MHACGYLYRPNHCMYWEISVIVVKNQRNDQWLIYSDQTLQSASQLRIKMKTSLTQGMCQYKEWNSWNDLKSSLHLLFIFYRSQKDCKKNYNEFGLICFKKLFICLVWSICKVHTAHFPYISGKWHMHGFCVFTSFIHVAPGISPHLQQFLIENMQRAL